MTEEDRDNIALFRYGLISPILNDQVTSQKNYLEEVSSKVHQVPYYGPKEFAPNTIECWLRTYRREGFNGLKPKRRSDRGETRRITSSLKEKLLELRKEKMSLSVSLFYDQLILKGEILPSDISYSTLYRLFKREGLLGNESLKEPERKRFAYDKVNILWQGDVSVGPYLKMKNKKIKTFLLAFIDDCSRLIPYAMFSTSEKFGALQKVLSEAILRRGIPKLLYVDNAKIYRSDQLHLACASLGISLIHTPPYDAPSKGKIERFFRTAKTRFFPLLTENDLSSLDNLNQKFWCWLERDYHRKVHSSIQMTPLDKFMSQISEVKTFDNPDLLKEIFLKRDQRKVKHDGTISVKKRLFEVPSGLINKRVEIRFDPENLEDVFIYLEDQYICQAKPVILSDNARVKRDRSTISFSKMSKEGVEENV